MERRLFFVGIEEDVGFGVWDFTCRDTFVTFYYISASTSWNPGCATARGQEEATWATWPSIHAYLLFQWHWKRQYWVGKEGLKGLSSSKSEGAGWVTWKGTGGNITPVNICFIWAQGWIWGNRKQNFGGDAGDKFQTGDYSKILGYFLARLLMKLSHNRKLHSRFSYHTLKFSWGKFIVIPKNWEQNLQMEMLVWFFQVPLGTKRRELLFSVQGDIKTLLEKYWPSAAGSGSWNVCWTPFRDSKFCRTLPAELFEHGGWRRWKVSSEE